MNKAILNRVINEGNYIIKYGKTVRETAKEFKVSKSTVHKDLKDRLKLIDQEAYSRIKKIIKYHTETRHIKGGESTKKKFQKLNKNV